MFDVGIENLSSLNKINLKILEMSLKRPYMTSALLH